MANVETRTRMSKAAAPDDPVLAQIVSRLVPALAPERIYLFGSQARGDTHRDSDYDILVVVKERVGQGREMERRAYAALRDLDIAEDIVVMTGEWFDWLATAVASLPATVLREGRLLYAA